MFFSVSWLHGASRTLHPFTLPGGSRSNGLVPGQSASSLSLQLQLPSKCLNATLSSSVNSWYRHGHLVSFMSLYGTWYIINNNILLDDYCMTAAMMNRSGGSNNHEQTEKQTKKQSVVLHLKINLEHREIHQGLKYFVDKATGIIGVFKCALLCTASLGMLAHLPPALTATWRQSGPLGVRHTLTPCQPLWSEAMTQMFYVQGFILIPEGQEFSARNNGMLAPLTDPSHYLYIYTHTYCCCCC